MYSNISQKGLKESCSSIIEYAGNIPRTCLASAKGFSVTPEKYIFGWEKKFPYSIQKVFIFLWGKLK